MCGKSMKEDLHIMPPAEETSTATVAVIDVGSNTIRALAGRKTGDGRVVVYGDDFVHSGLGRGLTETGRLPAEAITTTAQFVRDFLSQHGPFDAVHCVGTAAPREAGNTGELAEALSVLGVELDVISGLQEARLTAAGALSMLPDLDADPVAIIDIGGRSSEISLKSGQRIQVKSLPVGAAEMTEKYLHSDPPVEREMQTLHAAAREALGKQQAMVRDAEALVGAGGTAVSVALMENNWQPSLEAVKKLTQRLSGVGLSERRKVMQFDPQRADVILGGLALVEAFVRIGATDTIHVSLGGIREGVLLNRVGATEIVWKTRPGSE
ncbi:MAG: hypothetical protein R6V19_02935 [Armatimonadota bacterium]